MKSAATVFSVAACAAFSALLASPAHAQWVADAPVPVTGHVVSVADPSNGGTGGGGTSASSGFCDAISDSSGSSDNAGSNYQFGNQWQITYSWTGSGSASFPMTVNVQPEVDGTGGGSIPAFGNASGSAMASDAANNSENAQAGGSCYVGGDTYSSQFSKTPIGTDLTFPKTEGPNPSLLITLQADTSGTCIGGPPGIIIPSGSYTMSSNAQVTVGDPQ